MSSKSKHDINELNSKLQSTNNIVNILEGIGQDRRIQAKHQKENQFGSMNKKENPEKTSKIKNLQRELPQETKLSFDAPEFAEKTKKKFYSMNKQKSNGQNSLGTNERNKKIQKIEDFEPEYILNYVKKSQKLTKQTDPEFAFKYFVNLVPYLKKPLIKKFKNCLFFGENPNKPSYQGFLYFFNDKFYYGNMMDEHKHGKGVEIYLETDTIYIGSFHRGRKQGIFEVRKPDEIYQGYLQKGKYHGTGRLTTPYTIYKGQFKQGCRHGKGEQLILKTGLKLCGQFKMNKFSNQMERKKQKKEQKVKGFGQFSNIYDYQFDDGSDEQYEKGRQMVRKIMNVQFQAEKVVELSEDENLPSPFQKYRKR